MNENMRLENYHDGILLNLWITFTRLLQPKNSFSRTLNSRLRSRHA
ncbi:hypothetical protein C900_02975 [Fulvivirga imtechensis AK7]|uniref:Uncharacterized protein n=1 Tax=Fulvivirga imtechensis AK7 TaxID=1237149 RepID=L8JQD8_9BACT|nr:hypothetical protein C900_02975 [Fulvivirga imtechensis AK7]